MADGSDSESDSGGKQPASIPPRDRCCTPKIRKPSVNSEMELDGPRAGITDPTLVQTSEEPTPLKRGTEIATETARCDLLN